MYDLFVIGGGSGGVRAARMAASKGLKVAIAEQQHWGGTCVNVGCVPKKLFVYAGSFHHEFEQAKHYGWNLPATNKLLEGYDWQRLVSNKNKEIARLNDIYISLLENAGVTLLNGKAVIVGDNQVKVNGEIQQAKNILIATGSTPWRPQIVGAEYSITSDEVFFLERLPKSMAIVGAGYIALEFACIFNALGVDVSVICRGRELLRHFDKDLRAEVTNNLTLQGIKVMTETNITALEKQSDGIQCQLDTASTLNVDEVFYATGRIPNLEGLFENVSDVELTDKGFINVDEHFQTSRANVYALGDLIGRVALTPVATAEAMQLVDFITTGTNKVIDYSKIATAIFVMPEAAVVGLSEDQVVAQGIKADIYTSRFTYLKHTLTDNKEKVFIKLIVDSETDVVLGAHMTGPHSAEMMQGIAVAVNANLTKAQFDQTIGIHPSIAEEWVTLRNKSYSV